MMQRPDMPVAANQIWLAATDSIQMVSSRYAVIPSMPGWVVGEDVAARVGME